MATMQTDEQMETMGDRQHISSFQSSIYIEFCSQQNICMRHGDRSVLITVLFLQI